MATNPLKVLPRPAAKYGLTVHPASQGNLELRLEQQKRKVLRRSDLASDHPGLESGITVAQVAGEQQSPRPLLGS